LYFLERVLRSPRVLLNTLLTLLALRLRLRRVPNQPVVIDIEPTNGCNFRCPHCQVTHADWVRQMLDPESFGKILRTFPNALRVKLQGMGEPFLNKSLPDFIELACAQGHWVEVISNASLFHKRPLADLTGLRNFELTVSIDGATKQTFESMRPGADFDQIVANLDGCPLELAAWMVVTEDNQHEIPAVVQMLSRLHIHKLGLQMVVVNYGKESLDDLTVAKRVGPTLALQDLAREAARCDVALSVSRTLYSRSRVCPWPWTGVYIDTRQNVVPCCRIGDAAVMSMGNLEEQSFAEIWNSPKYQEFRDAHRTGRIPAVCTSCYAAPDGGPARTADAPRVT
jgi:pyrroloquinoline quinone biosynthesis protein E